MENPIRDQTIDRQATAEASIGLGQTTDTPGQSLDSPFAPTPQLTPQELGQPNIEPTQHTIWQSLLRYKVALLVILVLVVGTVVLLRRANQASSSVAAGDFDATHLSLAALAPSEVTSDISKQSLTINGQLQLASSLIITPSAQPPSGVVGQIYFDQTTHQLNYYDGSAFLPIGGNTTFIQNTTNVLGGTTNITNVANATAGITTPGGTTNALLKFTSAQTAGDSIAIDNSTYLQVNGGINVAASSQTSDFTFWSSTAGPVAAPATDPLAVELGVKFQTDISGSIKGIRFYKDSTTTGPNVGSLWTSGGTLLAQATFTTTPGNGWQEVDFPSPIPISSDTTYVASYHTTGGYPYDAAYFGASGVDSGPLHALASGLDGGNGVFKYGAGSTFPNQSSNSPNYWVDVVFSGSTYTPDSRIRVNGTQLSTNDLADNATIAKRGASQVFSGHNIFRNGSDSGDAFSIQRADTTNMFTVDTLGNAIYIGAAGGGNNGTILVLGRQTGNANDPAGIDGAMYYNASLGTFRCYEDGEWGECGQPNAVRGYSVYDEFMGGQTTTFGTNNIIGSLGWNAQAIGANGSINFNPSTPAPIADRPGVLQLQTPAVANQGTSLILGNANGGSMFIAKSQSLHTAVAVGAATGQVLRIGLHNETTTTTQPVSGVWWEADPGTNPDWRYCYGNGTTATCTDSTQPIAANTWVRLSITISATGTGTSAARFSLNGTAMAGFSAVTIDTTNRVSPAFSCYGTDGNAQNCYWDYFQLKGVTSGAR